MSADPFEMAAAARARAESALAARLTALGTDSLPEGIQVDAFTFLQRCPARLTHPAADYEDRVATVRRRLGLAALRLAWSAPEAGGPREGPPGDLTAAVEAALADREDWSTGLRDWFGSLGPAGQAAVGAAVLTWCADVVALLMRNGATPDALRAVGWANPFRPLRSDLRIAGDSGATTVRLRASPDAELRRRGRSVRLFVLRDAPPGPGDRLRAGLVALVHAFGSRRAPLGVSIGSPAAGTIERVEVDGALLDLTVDRVVEVVGHLADPDRAPAVPGPWCSHCHLRDACDEGAEFLSARAVPVQSAGDATT